MRWNLLPVLALVIITAVATPAAATDPDACAAADPRISITRNGCGIGSAWPQPHSSVVVINPFLATPRLVRPIPIQERLHGGFVVAQPLDLDGLNRTDSRDRLIIPSGTTVRHCQSPDVVTKLGRDSVDAAGPDHHDRRTAYRGERHPRPDSTRTSTLGPTGRFNPVHVRPVLPAHRARQTIRHGGRGWHNEGNVTSSLDERR